MTTMTRQTRVQLVWLVLMAIWAAVVLASDAPERLGTPMWATFLLGALVALPLRGAAELIVWAFYARRRRAQRAMEQAEVARLEEGLRARGIL